VIECFCNKQSIINEVKLLWHKEFYLSSTEEETRGTGMTAPAGLPVYLDLALVMGISDNVEKHLHIKQQNLLEGIGRRCCPWF
jgi:hypothetical protein